MALTSLLQTVFFNLHAVLTLFALVIGSIAVSTFLYQAWIEQRRKFHGDNNDFAVFDE